MSRSFKLIEPHCAEAEAQSTSVQPVTETDWSLYAIYQEMMQESLTSPSQNTCQDKGSSYSILAGHLSRFNELGLLPRSFLLRRLDEGSGVEAALSANNARYHKTCRLRYNKTKLDRSEKRHLKIAADTEKEVAAHIQTRYLSEPSNI